MPQATTSRRDSFRIGKVQAYRRGQIWYLCYHQNGMRQRPRVGPDRDQARQLASQTNAQLENNAPTQLSFTAISIPELQRAWLEHHEHVLRSSVATVNRYRSATDHLLNFVRHLRPIRQAAQFSAQDAESFVRYLRTIEVSPNGHRNSAKRRLLDHGVKYILHCCGTLFNYAAKRRHLSPYAENPFSTIQIDRIPVEDAKTIVVFTADQERQFLQACDDWQFPVFLTLILTGLRPGELCHLLVEDLELGGNEPILRVRNKKKLGWQIKTRNERDIPVLPALRDVLKRAIGPRRFGPAFTRPACRHSELRSAADLEGALYDQIAAEERRLARSLDRKERLSAAKSLWWEIGAMREDRLRLEFMNVTAKIGLPQVTMPKVLRHLFATTLQDGNVDPLIRNQLMGHVPAIANSARGGLGMTSVYTHSRPETMRKQMGEAFAARPVVREAEMWLEIRAISRDADAAQ